MTDTQLSSRTFHSFLRRWPVGLIVLVLATAASFLFVRGGASFNAKVQMMAVPSVPATEADATFVQTNQSLILRSYQNMATSHQVVDPVVEKLGHGVTYEEIVDRFEVVYGGNSLMMAVEVRNQASQEEANRLANAVAESFVANAKHAVGLEGKNYAPDMQILEPARAMTSSELMGPTPPSRMQRLLISGLVGVVAGVVAMIVATMVAVRPSPRGRDVRGGGDHDEPKDVITQR